jgi:hypothetical protein
MDSISSFDEGGSYQVDPWKNKWKLLSSILAAGKVYRFLGKVIAN